MKKQEDAGFKPALPKNKKEENWLDAVMERQKQDLETEEEILSSVPNRIKYKWIDEENEW